jgi:hypothetical protein
MRSQEFEPIGFMESIYYSPSRWKVRLEKPAQEPVDAAAIPS